MKKKRNPLMSLLNEGAFRIYPEIKSTDPLPSDLYREPGNRQREVGHIWINRDTGCVFILKSIHYNECNWIKYEVSASPIDGLLKPTT